MLKNSNDNKIHCNIILSIEGSPALHSDSETEGHPVRAQPDCHSRYVSLFPGTYKLLLYNCVYAPKCTKRVCGLTWIFFPFFRSFALSTTISFFSTYKAVDRSPVSFRIRRSSSVIIASSDQFLMHLLPAFAVYPFNVAAISLVNSVLFSTSALLICDHRCIIILRPLNSTVHADVSNKYFHII